MESEIERAEKELKQAQDEVKVKEIREKIAEIKGEQKLPQLKKDAPLIGGVIFGSLLFILSGNILLGVIVGIGIFLGLSKKIKMGD